jgi:hypothetical protein
MCCWSRFCEDSASISPRITICKINSLLKSLNMDTNENRAENFFFITFHIFSYIINDSWSNKISLRIFLIDIVCTIKNDISTISICWFNKLNNSHF